MDVVHVIPQEYVVDGQDGIKDPVGMSGVRLEVDVHIVAGAQGPLQNLSALRQRCRHQRRRDRGSVARLGFAVLDDSEKELTHRPD